MKPKNHIMHEDIYTCIRQNTKKNGDLQSIMSNLQPNCCLKADFQKADKHTGGKWLIHDTKRRKDNQLQSLKLPCRISYLSILMRHKGVPWYHVESDIKDQFYRCRDCYHQDKAVMRLSYHHHENPNDDKMASLYRDGTLVLWWWAFAWEMKDNIKTLSFTKQKIPL